MTVEETAWSLLHGQDGDMAFSAGQPSCLKEEHTGHERSPLTVKTLVIGCTEIDSNPLVLASWHTMKRKGL